LWVDAEHSACTGGSDSNAKGKLAHQVVIKKLQKKPFSNIFLEGIQILTLSMRLAFEYDSINELPFSNEHLRTLLPVTQEMFKRTINYSI
jgi:hypothetical protein